MTSRELNYLSDTLKSEQIMIKKYQDYGNIVQDQQLKTVCNDMVRKHQEHYTQLVQQLNS